MLSHVLLERGIRQPFDELASLVDARTVLPARARLVDEWVSEALRHRRTGVGLAALLLPQLDQQRVAGIVRGPGRVGEQVPARSA